MSISLGWNGALVALSHELPIGVGPAAGAASPPDRRAVFALARLDLDAFEAAPPRVSTQRSAGDTRLAWLERDGGPLGARRVEASLFRNELVAFSTVHDRAVPADTGPGADNAPRTRDVAQRLVSIVFDALLVVGVLIAWRQVRDGRADLRGATRLGFALLLCLVAARLLFRERLFATLGSDPIFRGMPFALASTAQVVIFYLAVEPFIRRRAPHQFISWSRLLAGRVTDPLVGRDLLTGILAGVVVQLIAHAAFWLELSASGPASTPLLGPLHIAEARQGVAYLLVVIHESVALTLVFTLLYAASVTVTRRTWAAVAVKFALGLAFVLASYNHWSGILVGALTLPIFLFVLLRIGTLGATALASTFFLINLDLVSDPGHWRFAATLAPGLVLLAVAGYAFAASTGLLRGRRGYGSLADS